MGEVEKERRIYANPSTGEVTIVSGFKEDSFEDLQKNHSIAQDRLIEKFEIKKERDKSMY